MNDETDNSSPRDCCFSADIIHPGVSAKGVSGVVTRHVPKYCQPALKPVQLIPRYHEDVNQYHQGLGCWDCWGHCAGEQLDSKAHECFYLFRNTGHGRATFRHRKSGQCTLVSFYKNYQLHVRSVSACKHPRKVPTRACSIARVGF